MQEPIIKNALPAIKGRGASINPENRFEKLNIEIEPQWLETEDGRQIKTEYFVDHSKEILAKNDSPDVSFTYSINPYRGCEHGCVYCYARPTHEYFGLSAGLDFETKIMVKLDAAARLEKKLRSQNWQPQVIALSGNTDCYQPVERELKLTQQCLEVFLKFRNPVGIITKNALILRDLDLLQELARFNCVRATLSITTLNHALARKMEPRTSSPAKRLEALERLAAAGIPTTVNVAPLIPGLTDHEIPQILKEAASRGASGAGYILLRLPYSVKELFLTWMNQHFADRTKKVVHAVQETRAGRLNDPCFSTRLSGTGVRAETFARLFEVSCQKYGLNQKQIKLSTEFFRRSTAVQQELFLH